MLIVWPLEPNSIRRAAYFELQMTKIDRAVMKLFDSIFKLEVPIPAPKFLEELPKKNFSS
jgi:hypothetical protein